MNNGDLIKRPEGQLPTEITPGQIAGILFHVEQLMQGMASVVEAMNRRMDELERQFRLQTPITGAQERAIGVQIKQRATELQKLYRLDAKAVTAIANAIRKDIKCAGSVNAIREIPRIEFGIYLERIAMWDDYKAMKEIRKRMQERKD